MKKIALLALFIGFAAFVSAQNLVLPNGSKIKGHVPTSIPAKNVKNHPKATNTFHVDYDASEDEYWAGTASYSRYIWDMNMHNKRALGDSNSLQYMVVGFDSLHDSYYETSMSGIRYQDLLTLTIDSIYVWGGHWNLSGLPDTLIAKIVRINTSSGYPTTTLLHADTMITDTSWSYGGTSWLSSCVLGFEPNYTITAPATNHFGVKMEYHGAKIDTFGILSGFGDGGAGMCAAAPTMQNFAYQTLFHPNSYRLDCYFESYGMLPTSSGADTYYDCDGVSGYLEGTDSDNFMQNNAIWVKVTFDDQLSVENAGLVNGLRLGQNVPNPAGNNTSIPYQIETGSHVSLNVYDLTGRLVMTVDQGNQAAGRHNIELNTTDLNNGIYYYTLNADNNRMTKKMIIAD